jgi:hypothetical protein
MSHAVWSWGTDVYIADNLPALRKAYISNSPMKDGSHTIVV